MKKVVLLVGLLACGGVWAGSVKSIDKELISCVNQAISASGEVTCTAEAFRAYDKILNKKDYLDENQQKQYQAVTKACEIPYAQEEPYLPADESWVMWCKIDVAKHFIKTKE